LFQAHVKRVAYYGVAYGNFVCPRYVPDEIFEIVEIEVVAGIKSETAFPCRFGCIYER